MSVELMPFYQQKKNPCKIIYLLYGCFKGVLVQFVVTVEAEIGYTFELYRALLRRFWYKMLYCIRMTMKLN